MLMLNRNMQPLFTLLKWLDGYAPGGNNLKVPNETTVPEFQKLNVALQEAVDRSETLYDQQKQFIGNASHELQTPLAVISNRIDWMIDQMGMNEEQMKELFQIRKELRYIIKLNKTLLLLTKIDNQQFPEVEEVDIAALIREQLEMFEDIYSYKKISCILQLPPSYIFKMNGTLANILISNLLKNAFVHAPEDSTIRLKLERNTLMVSNVGAFPLDNERIFERFYQGSKKEGSSGLGLALVNAIANYYDLKLEYSYKNGQHQFEVVW